MATLLLLRYGFVHGSRTAAMVCHTRTPVGDRASPLGGSQL